MEPIQPIVPEGTPLPTPPVGVPPFPITPFAVWTWSTPVIPEFYWNCYSSEQRIKQICKEIGRIEAYLNYLVNETNKNIIEIHDLIQKLTDRVAALEKKVEEEVARLDGLIAQLRADLEQEIKDRQDADAALDDRIDQEINDRQHADNTLHEEIAQEVEDRTHADDALHTEISTETQNRIHADDQLHDEVSKRLLPTDVQAGEEISITRPDPNSNTIIIASTVAHSISELASTVSGLQAALTSETAERRADDSKLWVAVNQRIERGKILAGPGIRVENDPDESTVTISATGGGTGGGSTTVAGTAPVEVTGTPEEGYNVSVSQATESEAGVITEARVKELAGEAGGSTTTVSGTAPVEVAGTPEAGYTVSVASAEEAKAGVITEARVKELAGGVAPSLSAEAPLKVEEGTISLTKDPAGPVTSSAAGLSVREVTPETESESEAGVVSKATIKSLATYSGGVNPSYGLDNSNVGGLRVKASPEVFGFNSSGELALSSKNTRSGEKDWNLPAANVIDRSGKPAFVIDLSMDGAMNTAQKFWIVNAKFQVKSSSSASWAAAGEGTFEAFVEASSTRGRLLVRCTPYGSTYYKGSAENKDSWSIAAVKVTYSVLGIPIEASAQ